METKHLILSIPEPKKTPSPQEKRKKVVAESAEWPLISQHLDPESQKKVLRELASSEQRETIHLHLDRAIKTKITGYKAQDMAKTLYDPLLFISYDQAIHSLIKSELRCFYCRGQVQLFYEYVREPKQWSLERIDNARGHNTDNVEIACLECNLRRKTMYHERFVFTKQAIIVKHGDAKSSGNA